MAEDCMATTPCAHTHTHMTCRLTYWQAYTRDPKVAVVACCCKACCSGHHVASSAGSNTRAARWCDGWAAEDAVWIAGTSSAVCCQGNKKTSHMCNSRLKIVVEVTSRSIKRHKAEKLHQHGMPFAITLWHLGLKPAMLSATCNKCHRLKSAWST
jgi:hypothetical protein